MRGEEAGQGVGRQDEGWGGRGREAGLRVSCPCGTPGLEMELGDALGWFDETV